MVPVMKRRWIVTFCLLAIIVCGGVAWWRLTLPPASAKDSAVALNATLPTTGSVEDKARQQVIGTWQDEYQGKRTMTLHADGTGTMLVELKGAAALLYATKLRFDMTWSLQDKKLIKKTIGGEPASKVNLIINTLGDTAEDTIVEVTEDRLLLLDKDGKTQYDWRRAKTEEKAKP